MTIREYWMLHGYKYVGGKEEAAKPVTHQDMKELELRLRQKGMID